MPARLRLLRQCVATVPEGRRCRNAARADGDVCAPHARPAPSRERSRVVYILAGPPRSNEVQTQAPPSSGRAPRLPRGG
jgi:hypothetical protein